MRFWMREFRPVKFIPAVEAFKPQVEITMNHDVNGWLHRRRREKYHLAKDQTYMVDEETAVDFITKGYAEGELPREVSDDERAERQAQMTRVSVG